MPYLRVFLSSLLCLALYAPMTGAAMAADGDHYFRLRMVLPVDMYDRPATAANVVLTLPPGAAGLKNLGCVEGDDGSEWCQVSYVGRSGWLQGKDVTEGVAPTEPSFDCMHKLNEIEDAICRDRSLIELDWMHDATYKAAKRVAETRRGDPDALKKLEMDHYAWIRSRDECWKAQDAKKQCIINSYERRTAYLQAQWLLAMNPESTVNYDCGSGRGLTVTFIGNSLHTVAMIGFEDQEDIFIQDRAASGARFTTDAGREFWIKGRAAKFTWVPKTTPLECDQITEAGQ